MFELVLEAATVSNANFITTKKEFDDLYHDGSDMDSEKFLAIWKRIIARNLLTWIPSLMKAEGMILS